MEMWISIESSTPTATMQRCKRSVRAEALVDNGLERVRFRLERCAVKICARNRIVRRGRAGVAGRGAAEQSGGSSVAIS
ncbi:hypothetical protein EVAR_50015_1 [Eumeta japonica]|uniref:Uncharacterized protein n=1 Tax=Eumeta variegata TaxID=151549 RepID=A0A4C1XNZ7_EUMVA|nr:hypothetical protein EVAR_50015_1 [Eumeta japonica]